jgi:peptidoglycan/xylan/chitin deacetylase (PgdA/CDA1 family)
MEKNLLRIITYHRVADPAKTPELNPRMISATPAVFAEQMQYLSGSFNVISMEQALEAVRCGKKLPERAVLITFDDGYFDFKDVAWPIMKKLKLPATVFVPTSYPGESDRFFWWDKLYAAFTQTTESKLQIENLDLLPLGNREQRLQSLKLIQNYVKTLPHKDAMELVIDICQSLGVENAVKQATMDWDQLRTLAREGVTLGAHTRTHPLLTRLEVDAALEEISGSYNDLKREIGDILPVFAYPNGNHDQTIVDVLIQEDLKLAVTVIDGFNDINTADPLRLHRTEVTQRTSLMLFRIRLQEWFSHVDKWRHRKKHLEEQVSSPVSNTPAT